VYGIFKYNVPAVVPIVSADVFIIGTGGAIPAETAAEGILAEIALLATRVNE
jgi:hypothetical protein